MDMGTTGDETTGGRAATDTVSPFQPPQPGAPRQSTLAPPSGAPVQPGATAPQPAAPSPYLAPKRALPPLAPIVARADRSAEPAADPEPAAEAPAAAPSPAAPAPAPAPTVTPPAVLLPPVPTTVFRSDDELAQLVAQAAPAPEATAPAAAAPVATPTATPTTPAFTPLTPLTPLTTAPAATPAVTPVTPAATAAKDATPAKGTPRKDASRKDAPRAPRGRPAARRPREARSTFANVVGVLVLLGLLAGGGLLVRRALSSESAVTAWPDDLAPLVQFVETARDATFDHPVRVERHGNDDYAAVLATEQYRAPLPSSPDVYASFLHTLGLLPEEDVEAAQTHLTVTHAEAFYSWRTQTIHVRDGGTAPSAAADAALVEALVDALYDQRFQAVERTPSTMDVVFAAADGARLAAEYAGGTSEADAEARDALDWSIEGPLDEAAVPWTIRDLVSAQALLPARLLRYTANHPGGSTIDGLTTGTLAEYRLIAPWLPEPAGATPELDAPVPDDVTVVATNEPFPMLPLLVSVSAWTDWPTARVAFQGWRTAVVSSYRRPEDDALCLSVKARFEQFPQEFVDGISAWGAAMGTQVTPVTSGDDVQFGLCDTATLAAPFPAEKAGATAAALLSVATAAAAKDEAERAVLLCAVDQVVRSGAADPLLRTRDIATALADVVRPNLLQLARQCRAGG